jgi:hypothetical protein
VAELERLYRASSVLIAVKADVARVKVGETSVDALRLVRKSNAPHLTNSYGTSLKLLLQRELTLAKRDRGTTYSLLGEALVVGLLAGAIFYGLAGVEFYTQPRSGVGALLFCCAILQRQAWQQIPIVLGKRPTFYKQRSRDFVPHRRLRGRDTARADPAQRAGHVYVVPHRLLYGGYGPAAALLRAICASIGAWASSASSAQYSASVK